MRGAAEGNLRSACVQQLDVWGVGVGGGSSQNGRKAV